MQRRLEIKLGLGERMRNGRGGAGDNTLDTDASDKVLHVGREAERHGLGRVEERLAVDERWRMLALNSVTVGIDSQGSISVMYIWPVVRDRWKREGARLLRQQTYVRKAVAAVCVANILRMSHRLSESAMFLIM